MSNPYKVYQKNQGPNWLSQLDKYIESPLAMDNIEAKKRDVTATMSYHGDNQAEKQVANATFVGKGKKYAAGGGIDAGEVENRGDKKANPQPSSADRRGSKWKRDEEFYGRRDYEPMGENAALEMSQTRQGNKRGGKVK